MAVHLSVSFSCCYSPHRQTYKCLHHSFGLRDDHSEVCLAAVGDQAVPRRWKRRRLGRYDLPQAASTRWAHITVHWTQKCRNTKTFEIWSYGNPNFSLTADGPVDWLLTNIRWTKSHMCAILSNKHFARDILRAFQRLSFLVESTMYLNAEVTEDLECVLKTGGRLWG